MPVVIPSLQPTIASSSKATIRARPRFRVNFSNGPYDANPVPYELSHKIRDDQPVHFSRGRQSELQSYDSGELSLVLDNRDRALEPLYAGGIYYPYILPDKRAEYVLEYPWLPGLFRTPTGFKSGVGEWVPSTVYSANCTLTTNPNTGYLADFKTNRGYSLRVTATIAQDAYFENNDWFACTVGEWFSFTLRFKPVTTSRTIYARLKWYNANFLLVGDSYASFYPDGADYAGYSRMGFSAQAPTNAAYVKAVIQIVAPAAGESHDFDAFVLQDRATFQGGLWPQIVTYTDDWSLETSGGKDMMIHFMGHDAFKLFGGKNISNSQFSAQVKAYTPSFYYRLGDGFGSTAAKDEMHATGATAYGSVVFGMSGASQVDLDTAADFTNGFLDAGTGPAWVGTGAQSISFAYRLAASSIAAFQQWPKADGVASNPAWMLVPAAGNWQWQGGSWSSAGVWGQTVTFNFPITYDNLWHYVTLVKAGDLVYRVFQDGVQVTPTAVFGCSIVGQDVSATSSLNFGSARFLIGGYNDQPAFAGQLDEVAVWLNTALTLAQHQAMYNLLKKAWVSQLSGARVNAVLDLIGWPATARNIDPGIQTLPDQIDSLAKTNVKSYLQTIEQTEFGQVFMDNQGRVRFIDRRSLQQGLYSWPSYVFGDRPGINDGPTGKKELAFEANAPKFSDVTFYTEVQVTRSIPGGGTGVTQLVLNPTLTNNPNRTLSRSGLLLMDDASAWQYANWLSGYYKKPQMKFDELIIDPVDDPDLWAAIVTLELGDRIAISIRPPGWSGAQATLRVEQFITGITGEDGYNHNKRIYKLGMVPSSPTLLLDHLTYGILDANNYLGF